MSDSIGLYIHIPFCKKKCAYCDFYSLTDLSRADRYQNSLEKHLAFAVDGARGRTVDTVYFGGGTPSLFGARRLDSLLDVIFSCYNVASDAEITVEVNPATIDYDGLFTLKSAGVNRLSIGLQSSNDVELARLSRIHDQDGFLATYNAARNAGFDNISVDLMYGIPEQTLGSLKKSLKLVCTLAPEHVSLYGLKLEPETLFGRMGNSLILPDDDAQCEMYEMAVDCLAGHGYDRYEISNFAKSGYHSRHNMRYWLGGEYLGFGPAAHSYVDGRRYCYPRDLDGYMSAVEQQGHPEMKDVQIITDREKDMEALIFGLRLEQGIAADAELLKRADMYIRLGFMRVVGDRLSFTTKGFLVSNAIIAELMD